MIVATCEHANRMKWGKTKAGTPRLRCKDCGKMLTESTEMFGGMRIGLDKAAKVIELLCEGMSVNATARVTGVRVPTILELLIYVGTKCDAYMQENIKGVFCDEIQVDEIWGFVFCKAATAKREKYVGGCGDNYCFTAIDRTTKLLVCWHMGRRTEQHTDQFIRKLEAATFGHFHISSDGWKSYPSTIKKHLGHRVDHGVMQKVYGKPINYPLSAYSPARIIGAYKSPRHGDVYQQDKICTSHVERMNGSIRLFCKRMNRLTYAFSKRWDNHLAALAMFFCHYNYCRKHATLKGHTPAMAHGLVTEAWSVRQMLVNVTNT
jgi:IS1 family transposase/transposase-like protein